MVAVPEFVYIRGLYEKTAGQLRNLSACSDSSKLTHKSFFPARSMDEPPGTTDPIDVHGPCSCFAEAYLICSCVLKRKYVPSEVLRTRPGSRTLHAPVQGRGLGNPSDRAAVNSSGITAKKRNGTIPTGQQQQQPVTKLEKNFRRRMCPCPCKIEGRIGGI